MTARALCVMTYALLAEGRDENGIAELDAALSPVDPRHGQTKWEAAMARWHEAAG